MSKLIIVCGLPATGKTSLAKALSEKLKIPCLHKDEIKESLYDSLKLSTLEDSRRIGKTAIELLLLYAKHKIRDEIDFILEAPFAYEEDVFNFQTWGKRYDLDIFIVICTVDNQVRYERFTSRPRHAAHHDMERGFENILCEKTPKTYSQFPGKRITVITDKNTDELVTNIITHFKL